jgi:AraC-like DNA-binding protein
MKQELKTIGIEQILRLSDTVDAYALGNDFILGEARGGNALVNTRILDVLQYPMRFDGYILFFLKKGAFQIDCNLNTYQVRERSLLVTTPGNILRIPSFSKEGLKGIELAFVVLSREFISGLHVDFNQVFQDSLRIMDNPCILLDEQQLQLSESFFQTARLVLSSPLNNKRQIIGGLFSALSYLAEDIWSEQLSRARLLPSEADPRVNQICERFLTLVSENYTSERGMQFYADKLCLTPKYLSKLVKEATGRSGPEWIDAHVILEAKNLLRYSGMSIKEIVYALHFPTASVFHKYFKAHTGLTPSEYRRGQ